MCGQLSFAGIDASPRPTDSVFFAIFPEVDAAASAARLAQHQCGEHGLTGKPVAAERLHVSLYSLGDYAGLPPGIVAAAREAAGAVVMPSFDVAFDRAISFNGKPNNLPFVLQGGDGVAGLMVLHQLLGAAMQRVGLGRWAQSHYLPHMTLLYDAQNVSGHTVETVRWTVHEFVLVHSLQRQSRYIHLDRWPLQG